MNSGTRNSVVRKIPGV